MKKKLNSLTEREYYKNRIETPKENNYINEINIFSEKKEKSIKKYNNKNKKELLLSNPNNINSINIINNNYNNIYLDSNKEKNYKILTFGNNTKDKPSTKSKTLKLVFNKNIGEKFDENKYKYIIEKLKNEINYYKTKKNSNNNRIIENSPLTKKKNDFKNNNNNKNLFLINNKFNTIKTYNNKLNIDDKYKKNNKSYHHYDTYNNNYIIPVLYQNSSNNKLITNYSLKNTLNINNNNIMNLEPKSNTNNFISLDTNTNRTFKYSTKRPKLNYYQNTSTNGINKSNNYISNDIIYEDDNNNFKKSYIHLKNIKLSSPIGLKKKIGTINFELNNYDGEIDNKDFNYKEKFELLKNRMNILIGNLFNIIDFQKQKLKNK